MRQASFSHLVEKNPLRLQILFPKNLTRSAKIEGKTPESYFLLVGLLLLALLHVSM
jgi:hypothetical protein